MMDLTPAAPLAPSPADTVPKRGRPRDPERVERVLAAAGRTFQEQGFERTSMDQVAKLAGVSKMTVYSYFPSKEALFEAAVERGSNNAIRAELPSMDPAQPREMLTAFGRSLLELVRHEHVARMMGVLFNLGESHLQVREAFYRQGPERMRALLAGQLKAANQLGTLQITQPELAADQFCSLFCNVGQMRIWLNVGRPTPDEDAALLKANVELFMKAFAPG